jgi:diguanylate cyclase (GGDEF)-like protein
MVLQESPDTPIETSYLALPPSILVKEAIRRMAEERTSCVIIIENHQLIGIFTERDVVRITTNMTLFETQTLAEVMTQEVKTLRTSETQDIFALSQFMSNNRIRHLPVLDEQDRIVGVVTPHSIRNIFKPEYLLRYVRVTEVMSQEVIHKFPSDSILIVAQQMTNRRVSCVVIVEPQTLFPLGILTEWDIVRFHKLNLDFTKVVARDVMSSPLSTMYPHDSLWSVHQTMQKLNVRRLVIVHPTGKLAGIVTQSQMLKILDPSEMYQVMVHMQGVIDRQTVEWQQLNNELQIANSELKNLLKTDDLTQIANRRQLNEFLYHEWERSTRFGEPLSLVMCDVDRFKSYNDTYGHLAGDECLIKIAGALRSATRKTSDLVARYGGEEFAIVLPNTNISGAESVAKHIIIQIENMQIPHVSSSVADYVTISLGVVTAIPDGGSSPELLLQTADRLLYQSKQQGRNTYRLKLLEI